MSNYMYCEHCNNNTGTEVKKSYETFMVRGESINVSTEVRFCINCGEKVYDEILDNKSIDLAFNIYRETHNIVDSTEIKEIRNEYGLSQRGFAALMGWSPATIARYETGAIPSSNNNLNLINVRDNLDFVENLFIANKEHMPKIDKNKLALKLKELKQWRNSSAIVNLVETRIEDINSTIFSGFKDFDYEIFKEMVIYLCSSINYVSKTKLNKLLFYSDFISFQKMILSMSGLAYEHNHYGPVPLNYTLLYESLKEDGVIDIIPFSNYEGEYIVPVNQDKFQYLSDQHIEILNSVIAKFKTFTAKDISDYSHEELAYSDTNQNEPISYEYALKLKSN